jgi:hypothetical protein
MRTEMQSTNRDFNAAARTLFLRNQKEQKRREKASVGRGKVDLLEPTFGSISGKSSYYMYRDTNTDIKRFVCLRAHPRRWKIDGCCAFISLSLSLSLFASSSSCFQAMPTYLVVYFAVFTRSTLFIFIISTDFMDKLAIHFLVEWPKLNFV